MLTSITRKILQFNRQEEHWVGGAVLTCCLQERENTDEHKTDPLCEKDRKEKKDWQLGEDDRKQGEVMVVVKAR